MAAIIPAMSDPIRVSDFAAVLFDMDGTLYHEQQALPGAAATVAALQQAGRVVACVTNNSARTAGELSRRLATMGIGIEPPHIHTAARAMAELILTRPLTNRARPRVFNFAGEALPVELDGRADLIDNSDGPCDVVAVGVHACENQIGFDMERAMAALAHLRRGATLIVGCNDRVVPIVGGGMEFGSGAWARLFAYAADLPEPRIRFAGKPQPEFFTSLCRHLDVMPDQCLLIGDNLEADIAGATSVGMRTALVLTGVSTTDDIAHGGIEPTWVVRDLPQLLDRLVM